MTRRAALLLAAGVALSAVPRAEAATPVPAPTVTWSVTGPTGVALPKNLTKASWSVDVPGDGGMLTIDALNPVGAKTVLDATFTTREIKGYKGFDLLQYKGTTTHSGAPSASTPASYSYGVRWRPAGNGPWSRWQDVSRGYPAGGPGGYEENLRFRLANPPKLVQVQFRLHVEVTDVAREEEEWLLQAL